MTDQLVHLCYGTGKIVAETQFSILSGLRHDPTPAHRIVVYTDGPDAFTHLPVDLREVDAAELDSWSGPNGYHFRRKYMTIIDALSSGADRVVFVDGDTWYRRDPALLFSRIGPTDTVLHVLENRLLDSGLPYNADLSRHVTARTWPLSGGRTFEFPANAQAWNSGVVGVMPEHLPLLNDAAALLDQIQDDTLKVHSTEQFVLGQVLERSTTVHEAVDVVFHYWDPALRASFHEVLDPLLVRSQGMSVPEQAAMLHRHRPRLRGRRLATKTASRVLARAGLRRPTIRSSG